MTKKDITNTNTNIATDLQSKDSPCEQSLAISDEQIVATESNIVMPIEQIANKSTIIDKQIAIEQQELQIVKTPNPLPRQEGFGIRFARSMANCVTVNNGYVAVKPIVAALLVIILLSSLVLGGLGLGVAISSSNRPKHIYNDVKSSIVYILCTDANDVLVNRGTGFFITSDGQIATCLHVVNNCNKISIVTSDNEYYIVEKIVGYDSANDLTILKIDKDNCNPIKFADSMPAIGEKIYTVSNPNGKFATLSEGIVCNYIETNGVTTLTSSAPISDGSSGAPLFNNNGKVVGVVRSIEQTTNNYSSAITVDKLTSMASIDMSMIDFIIANSTDIGGLLESYVDTSGNVHITGVKTTINYPYVYIPATLGGRPVTVVEIDSTSSAYLKGVKHITLCEGIEIIGNNGFVGALKLISIYVPSTVFMIMPEAFNNQNLSKIMLAQDNQFYTMEDKVLYDKDKKILYKYDKDITTEEFTIPDTVEYIASGAFANNNFLTTIKMSSKLIQIGQNYDLELISNTQGAFANCQKLRNVYFHNLTEPLLIGCRTFSGCNKLKKITLPPAVATLGDEAFENCISLESVIFEGDVLPNLGVNICYNSKKVLFYVLQNSLQDAQHREDAKDYLDIIKLYRG